MIRRLAHSRSGVAAVEFALVGGILAALMVGVLDLWTYGTRVSQTRQGVEAGVQYVMAGGTSDAAAREVSLSAWKNRPEDGDVRTSRECRCGEVVSLCTTQCAGKPPAMYLRLEAVTEKGGLFSERAVRHEQSVRLR